LSHVEVERPVTEPPPHRSLRAELPHRAPRQHSLALRLIRRQQPFRAGASVSAASLIFPSVRFASCYPALHVRHVFPLRAACCRPPLPHVTGFTVSEYYGRVRLPANRQLSFFLLYGLPDNGVLPSGSLRGLTSSCHFSPYMPRPRTPAAPPESYHSDSFVLPSVTLKTSAAALMLLSMLTWLQGCAYSPAAYTVLCVRFAPFVHARGSRNRLRRSAGRATLDTGGWSVLAKSAFLLNLSRQGLSP